jgi:L-alanine-DL-glutamate epimerase-like enolase superfamily enzyme
MKITDVTMTQFSLGPLPRPYWNSIIRTANKGFSRIEIHTDEGVTGLSFGGHRDLVLGRFRELLIGQDPLDAEACWHRLYAHNRKPVAKGEYISAIGVTDIALWDLRGKALNLPCWR